MCKIYQHDRHTPQLYSHFPPVKGRVQLHREPYILALQQSITQSPFKGALICSITPSATSSGIAEPNGKPDAAFRIRADEFKAKTELEDIVEDRPIYSERERVRRHVDHVLF